MSPTVVGDVVIIGSCAGTLYALDRKSGTPLWSYDTAADGPAAQFHGEPLVLGTRVVIPTDSDPKGHLYAFDIASGDLLWKLPFNHGVSTSPLLAGDAVVALSAEGELVAVAPKTGNVIWSKTPAGAVQPTSFLPSPAYAAGRILIADNTDKVLAVDARSGQTSWLATLPARANTSLVVALDQLVVGTMDGYLNWLALDSGKVTRRVHLDGHPYGTPILASPLLFVLAGNNLVALDAESGAVRWKQKTSKEWTTYRPLVAGSTVIAGSTEKDLCAFDRNSGERRWCRAAGEVPRGLGISSDGMLYAGSLSGVVQAFRLTGPPAAAADRSPR